MLPNPTSPSDSTTDRSGAQHIASLPAFPTVYAVSAATTTPPQTAPREQPCTSPHIYASSTALPTTRPMRQTQCPRHSSPNKTGVHCTGTSGKKTMILKPPPCPWTPSHPLKTPRQRPVTPSLPASTSPDAYDHRPPWKCTSQQSIPSQPSPAADRHPIRPLVLPLSTPSPPTL